MIPQIKKILFASDLTENSRHAFYYAASTATRHGGSIILLHVVEKLPTGMRQRLAMLGRTDTLQELREAHEREVRDILIGKNKDYCLIHNALTDFYQSANSKGANLNCGPQDILIEEGDVAEEILKAASHHNCDLIVMGSHTGIWGATAIGSATKTVLHKSRVPVLIVPPPCED